MDDVAKSRNWIRGFRSRPIAVLASMAVAAVGFGFSAFFEGCIGWHGERAANAFLQPEGRTPSFPERIDSLPAGGGGGSHGGRGGGPDGGGGGGGGSDVVLEDGSGGE